MTTALDPRRTVYLPEPKPHQWPILDDPSRRKLWRAGRRTGKSRAALIAATWGHGPGDLLRGITSGASGCWISPDFPQARAIWREEIEPRFAGLDGVDVNQAEHRVSIRGAGRLELRSAENIDSVRGSGLDFAILDEAAHFDLAYALNDVILPALLDREGWLFVISSPNAGHDGNADHETPSYFNRLCGEIADGLRPDWRQWHNRTEDNRTLSADAIAALRADYPAGSLTAKQELDAELLEGGAGFALPYLDAATHLVQPFEIPNTWPRFGSFDWGFNHPFVFLAWVAGPDGVLYLLQSVTARHQTPHEIADTVAAAGVDITQLRYIIAGTDCWNLDTAKGIEVPAIAETLGKRHWHLIPVPQDGKRPRHQRLDTFRRYVGWPAGSGRAAMPPRLFVLDTPANRDTFAAWRRMLLDPLDLEAPLKVDARENGQGGDDAYDAASYALASRLQVAKERPLAQQGATLRQRAAQDLATLDKPKKTGAGRGFTVLRQ